MRHQISPAAKAMIRQTNEYAISVSWNPNHYWMVFEGHKAQDAARREFEACLTHADGMQVDLIENGQVIASACGLN
jgi:hypothetical protein